MSETALRAEPPQQQSSLRPLYVASTVCSMGMMGFVAAAGPLADTLGLSAWQIGLTATAGGAAWVFSARAWGRAADRLGRKSVLRMGLVGFTVAYVLLCAAAHVGIAWSLSPLVALAMLILTRFGMGLTYSAIPAASAAVVADHHGPETRAGAMGKLAAAQSSGLLLGPAFVAAMASSSPTVPLFLLALLPIPAFAYLVVVLPADTKAPDADAAQLPLHDARVLRPVMAAFTVLIAVGIAQIVIGFIALDRLQLPNSDALRVAGLALTSVGVCLVVAQLAVKRLDLSPYQLMRVGALISAVGFVASAFAPSAGTLIASYAFAGFGAGWVFPAISAAAANAVSDSEQGRAAGAVSSAMGLGAMVAPLIGGSLYTLSGNIPLIIGAGAMLLIAVIARQARAPA
ncbi:MAG: MFS transporter [Pseudomonadota bacterium]